ncbi:MAG: hypothetical protein JOZ36_07760 [Acidobacteria bacterium]|nr:hypothetical protein [Acidobacteriota bacterium]
MREWPYEVLDDLFKNMVFVISSGGRHFDDRLEPRVFIVSQRALFRTVPCGERNVARRAAKQKLIQAAD